MGTLASNRWKRRCQENLRWKCNNTQRKEAMVMIQRLKRWRTEVYNRNPGETFLFTLRFASVALISCLSEGSFVWKMMIWGSSFWTVAVFRVYVSVYVRVLSRKLGFIVNSRLPLWLLCLFLIYCPTIRVFGLWEQGLLVKIQKMGFGICFGCLMLFSCYVLWYFGCLMVFMVKYWPKWYLSLLPCVKSLYCHAKLSYNCFSSSSFYTSYCEPRVNTLEDF